MNRRDIIKGALAGAGAIAAPAQDTSHAAHAAAQSSGTATAGWKPLTFDDHQNQTVVMISELIIPQTDTPGAKEAKVNEYIDLILAEGATERRVRFLQGLGWIDGYAIRQNGKPFIGCTPEQQVSMLRSLDEATADNLRGGAEFFRQIKQLTVQGYYTSKIGIDELNKGGRVPGSFACTHQGSH